jgi:metal-sulfur cluster biosynthetic enzyme
MTPAVATAADRALEQAVLRALDGVRDPELDEALPALGFVASVTVTAGAAEVRLRLPTYFCAANFSFLMAADAQRAAAAVPGVCSVKVVLQDHYAADEINAGLAADTGFDAAFAGEGDGSGLEDLRLLFRRKAFLARQQRLCERLIAAGHTPEGLAALTLADLPADEDAALYRSRRAELGLPMSPGAPLVVSPAGERVEAAAMAHQLRIGRMVKVSIEGNAGLCRGLLATRYGEEEPA